jgi:hypothetical protein
MRNWLAHPWQNPAEPSRPRTKWTFAIRLPFLLTCLFASGCANPGPPRSPSLHLPQQAAGISAQRIGDQVVVKWTTPQKTTDGQPIQGVITAEICREVGSRPATPAARKAACVAVQRLPVTPGPSQVIDPLTPALEADPVTLLTYRIQLFNAFGRSAGESSEAGFAAAGAALPVIEELRATNLETSVVLEWQRAAWAGNPATLQPATVQIATVQIERLDLNPPAPGHPSARAPARTDAPPGSNASPKPDVARPAGKQKAGPAAGSGKKTASPDTEQTELRADEDAAANPAASSRAGMIDQTAEFGHSYRYIAERVRGVTIGVHALEIDSAPSAAVTLVRRDVFPPHRPSGLAAVPASDPGHPSAIDLSWDAGTEADLAGYLVYRRTVSPDGKLGDAVKLTASPVAEPAFRDATAVSGSRYAYQVAAVDNAGNQSPLSESTEETAPHPQ